MRPNLNGVKLESKSKPQPLLTFRYDILFIMQFLPQACLCFLGGENAEVHGHRRQSQRFGEPATAWAGHILPHASRE